MLGTTAVPIRLYAPSLPAAAAAVTTYYSFLIYYLNK